MDIVWRITDVKELITVLMDRLNKAQAVLTTVPLKHSFTNKVVYLNAQLAIPIMDLEDVFKLPILQTAPLDNIEKEVLVLISAQLATLLIIFYLFAKNALMDANFVSMMISVSAVNPAIFLKIMSVFPE